MLTDEFIEKARESLPPTPEYLISTLLKMPHNLSLGLAKRLATSPSEFSYYKTIKERSPQSLNGQIICNWYSEPHSELGLIQACLSLDAIVTAIPHIT